MIKAGYVRGEILKGTKKYVKKKTEIIAHCCII